MAAARSPYRSTKGNPSCACADRDQGLNTLKQAYGIPGDRWGLLLREMEWSARCLALLFRGKVACQPAVSLRRERKLMNGRGAARWKEFVNSPVSLVTVVVFVALLSTVLGNKPA